MSSIKFDEVACENVIKALDDVSLILGEVSGDVQEFLNGNPSLTAIDRQIKRRSTKTRTVELDDGTTEEETYIIDLFCKNHGAVVIYDHTSGYHGEYGVLASLMLIANPPPLPACKSNLLRLVTILWVMV